ncbi:MAG: hypothetical protein LC662_03425 [Rhodothermaceae bacterium]|nr:hypothetical protein [Rhodothermaceae bacterium]
MAKKFRLTFFCLLLIPCQEIVKAQTCSCAGAPLLASQNYGITGSGNIAIGITHEYNDIANLYSGASFLDDKNSARTTNSTLFEISYGISRRFSLSGTFSYVIKNRITGLQTGNPEDVTTRGLGDGVFLLKYVVKESSLASQYNIVFGSGVKAPFGTTSIRLNRFLMNADMQPGSGAWDTVAWSYFSTTFVPHTNLSLYLVNSYRLTGTNERFGVDDRYRFGNEWISVLGAGNSITDRLGYSLSIRFRHTMQDQRNEQNMPNTGGTWIILNPEISIGISDQLKINVGSQIPVYQYLKGTQPTTSYTLSASVFYNFKKESGFVRF